MPISDVDVSSYYRAKDENGRVNGPDPPFDPRTEVSADARYVVKYLVLWFFVLPIVLGILALGLSKALAQ